ncbi:MAG: hypothetical protein JWO38_5344 [Gemmataceae bacterium]|nr:hypothetical protein [Gemmataceae bacterium]
MTLGPFPSELVNDPQFDELVGRLCSHPQMYVNPVSFGAVCAYLDGFNAARNGGPLIGFQPWLVVRAKDGNNLHWQGLARRLLPTVADDVALPVEERAIRALGRLIAEYLEYRRTNGLTKVFNDYSRWLLRRSWYTGPLRRKPEEGSDYGRG